MEAVPKVKFETWKTIFLLNNGKKLTVRSDRQFNNPTANETAKKFEEFMKKFNSYLDESNNQNSSANLYSFVGYLAACFTALVSAFMEWRSLRKNRKPIVG